MFDVVSQYLYIMHVPTLHIVLPYLLCTNIHYIHISKCIHMYHILTERTSTFVQYMHYIHISAYVHMYLHYIHTYLHFIHTYLHYIHTYLHYIHMDIHIFSYTLTHLFCLSDIIIMQHHLFLQSLVKRLFTRLVPRGMRAWCSS